MTCNIIIRDHSNGYYELSDEAGCNVADITTTEEKGKKIHMVSAFGSLSQLLGSGKKHTSIDAALSYMIDCYDDLFCTIYKQVSSRIYNVVQDDTVIISVHKGVSTSVQGVLPLPIIEVALPVPTTNNTVPKEIALQLLEMPGIDWGDGSEQYIHVAIDLYFPKNIIAILRSMREHGYDNARYSNSSDIKVRVSEHRTLLLRAMVNAGIIVSELDQTLVNASENWKNDIIPSNKLLVVQVCTRAGVSELSRALHEAGLMVQDGKRFVLV